MSSNLILVFQLCLELYNLNTTHSSDHSHLCPQKCHLIFFSYRPELASMKHTTSQTTAVQSPCHFQWYVLIGKQWYKLPAFIPSSLNSVENGGLTMCMCAFLCSRCVFTTIWFTSCLSTGLCSIFSTYKALWRQLQLCTSISWCWC